MATKKVYKPAEVAFEEYFCDFCLEKISDSRWSDGGGGKIWNGAVIQADKMKDQVVVAEQDFDGYSIIVRDKYEQYIAREYSYSACHKCTKNIQEMLDKMVVKFPEEEQNEKAS